jgi:hypothetical protein
MEWQVANEANTSCIKAGGIQLVSDCREKGLEYLNDTGQTVFDHNCIACPLGASCQNTRGKAVTWDEVRAKFGYARCPNAAPGVNLAFQECQFEGACMGATNS